MLALTVCSVSNFFFFFQFQCFHKSVTSFSQDFHVVNFASFATLDFVVLYIVVSKAWKLHFYLWCWGNIVNFAKSSFTNHAEEWFVVQLQQLVRKNWRNCALNPSSDAYYVMRCLVVFGYRCAPPQRLVLLPLLRSGVRARRCSVCRRLARTGGKLERRRPTTESGFFKKLQENLILVPTVNFKAVKLLVHWTRFISSVITKPESWQSLPNGNQVRIALWHLNFAGFLQSTFEFPGLINLQ